MLHRADRNRARQSHHSFRATGIGGSQERRHARKGGGNGDHASTRTTRLYDRRRDELSLDQVERIVI
jgi:hypothetical protein